MPGLDVFRHDQQRLNGVFSLCPSEPCTAAQRVLVLRVTLMIIRVNENDCTRIPPQRLT